MTDLSRIDRRWWMLAGVGLLAILFECAGDQGRELLRYDRAAIGHAEIWRLITGHLVHLGPAHLALNLAGLLLMGLLFLRDYSPLRWLWILALSAASIDAGLFSLDRSLQWYVGLSGVLHGVMAAGVLAHWRRRHRDAWILTLFLIGKLAWEHWAGPLPYSQSSAGGPVIVDAHLYGALGGAVAAAIIRRP